MTAFIPYIAIRPSITSLPNLQTSRRRHRAFAATQPRCQASTPATQSTEDTFAIDAGRDLFFSGMTPELAIEILERPLGSLESKDDRFIAAERLKFFTGEYCTRALIKFIRCFEGVEGVILEDKVARRKAAESLGRHKGGVEAIKEESIELLMTLLDDEDSYMIEVAVWSLSEAGVGGRQDVLQAVASVLKNPDVNSRVVVHTMLKLNYVPALPDIKLLMQSPDLVIASAAHAAATVLEGVDHMPFVLDLLRSQQLNVRRSAIEDITLAKYTPALQAVAKAPNSLVLRTRAIRVLLDSLRENGEPITVDMWQIVDRMLWDHPYDNDLLGLKKETRKSREVAKNIRQLYKNDALPSYLATRTLAEDHQENDEVGAMVLKSYHDLGYFDYFGAYHVYKTLGWLHYSGGYDLLIESAEKLPPRFFNHQVGAIMALAELGDIKTIPVLERVAAQSNIWELKYACLMAVQRLGGELEVRATGDWLIDERRRAGGTFAHLRSGFELEQ